MRPPSGASRLKIAAAANQLMIRLCLRIESANMDRHGLSSITPCFSFRFVLFLRRFQAGRMAERIWPVVVTKFTHSHEEAIHDRHRDTAGLGQRWETLTKVRQGALLAAVWIRINPAEMADRPRQAPWLVDRSADGHG